MMNFGFRLLLTFNATSLLIIIFLVQRGYTDFWYDVVYFIPVLLTWVSIKLSSRLGKDEFKAGDVVSVEYANNGFLPNYLGYFFVALSVDDWVTLSTVYGILFVFTFLSQALYFNPLFLLFRFKFYNIKTKSGVAIFLISCKNYKTPSSINIPKAYRINNYTFIEKD